MSDVDRAGTEVALRIGTPIEASNSCYELAFTTAEMNGCSIERHDYLAEQFGVLKAKIRETYRYKFLAPAKEEQFVKLLDDWEVWVERYCEFESGHKLIEEDGVLRYEGGSMAINNYNECYVAQYEAQLRQLQFKLFSLSQ